MEIVKKLIILSALSLAPSVFASATAGGIPDVAASYKPNIQAVSPGFENLKLLKQCNTDWGKARQSSKPYRELCFEALTALSHPYPQTIMLTNEQDEQSCLDPAAFTGKEAAAGGCIIKNPGQEYQIGRGIQFRESYWNGQKYGAKRLSMYHEAWHMAAKHYYKNIKNCDYPTLQKLEKDADKAAVIKGACIECTREFVEWFLAMNNREPRYTIEDLDDMTLEHITNLIVKLEPQSLARKAEHPLSLERALRIYRYTRIPIEELKDHPHCPYHKVQRDELMAKIKARRAQLEKEKALKQEIKELEKALEAKRERARISDKK